MKITVLGILVFITHCFVKLNEESLKKVSFENWKLGNTGKVIERNTLYSTSKMR